MHHRITRLAVAALLPLIVLIATTTAASAHAVTHFGKYYVAIGWVNEPAYTGQPNAVQVFVREGTVSGTAVSNLQPGELKVQVVAPGGARSSELPLQPSADPDTGLGNPSEYDADLIPTVPGNYTFILTGDIDGLSVNRSFTAGPETFATVQDADGSGVEFPNQITSPEQQATLVKQLQNRVTTLQGQVAALPTGGDGAAVALAIAALAVAIVLGGGGLVMATRRRG